MAERGKLSRIVNLLLVLIVLVQPMQYGVDVNAVVRGALAGLGLVEKVGTADADQPAPASTEKELSSLKKSARRLVEAVPSAYFTVADGLIWVAFFLWLLSLIANRGLPVNLIPLSVALFLGWTIVSVIPHFKPLGLSVNGKEAAKEIIQYFEYFLVVYLLYLNNARKPEGFRRIAYTLLFANTAVIAVGLVQYISPAWVEVLPAPLADVFSADSPFEVRATFGNRNVLAGYLALMLPLMWGIVMSHRSIFVRLWLAVLTVAGLVITLSGGVMLAIVFAILMITFIRSEKAFAIVAVIGLVACIYLAPQLPMKNGNVLRDSVLLYKRDAPWPWQQKYVEWQAALNAINSNPVTGVGIGNYQLNINRYYLDIEKPPENLMEPDAVNGWMVTGVTLGVPGLLLLLWMLLSFQKRASMHYGAAEPGIVKGFCLGVYGAIGSFMIASLFTNLLVRGVGIAFVIMVALVDAAWRSPRPEERDQEEEQE